MFGILEDLVKIAAAPVKIAADLTRVVTKPVADVADFVAKETKDFVKDLTD